MTQSNEIPKLVPVPMPMPMPMPVPMPMLIPSVDRPSQGLDHFDFEFLINIIKGLENTIALLNRRLEAYENANASANVSVGVGEEVVKVVNKEVNSSSKNVNETSINVTKSSKNDHSRTVHENSVSTKCLGKANGSIEKVHENQRVQRCMDVTTGSKNDHLKSVHENVDNNVLNNAKISFYNNEIMQS